MSNKNKQFRVAVIADLTDREWQVLSTAARLTTSRARSYIFETPSYLAPDIFLVDGDSADARQLWHAARALHSAPAVFLKADATSPASGTREFRRPLVPSCLLGLVSLLDEVTVEELHFLPELCIGGESATTDAPLEVKSARHGRYSALVVDDSSTVRAQVGLGLKMFGISADFAETAEDAFQLLSKNSYDIAFLDVVLPGADGYQICKAIKKDKNTNTSVIMLTSKSSTFDRVKANLAGCDAFLTKPVENALFQQVVRKYLTDSDTLNDSVQSMAAK